MATRDKNVWILLIFILSGLVIGGLIAEIANHVEGLWFLAYGQGFGLETMTLNLGVINITFGLSIKITISSIIGMALAILIYRKV